MNVTKERVKIEIDISSTNTTYDADITATIPKAEARYRTVANFNFSTQFITTYASGDNTFTLSTHSDSLANDLNYGDLIDGVGVPDETYITDIDTINGIITVSEDFTDSGTTLILCQNIEYWPVISALVWYMMSKQSTTSILTTNIKSKSVGPLSITYDNSNINRRYGIPESIVQSIPQYGALM